MSSKDETISLGPACNTTLAAAISAVVGGVGAAQAADGVLEEIVVTASKRGEQNIQDMAGTIQAIGTEDLRRQSLFGLEDLTRILPSVSYFGNSPGAGKVYFRGVADAPDTFIADSSAAVYLDEQPITQGAQMDVRLIDIERVEALSGPQGTLFGSSSQSGTLRIVTNKPNPTEFEAFADVTLKTGSDSDASYDIAGMINLPLVEDKFAIRLVGFTATEGGFIDNVRGQTPSSETGYRNGSINGIQYNDGTRDNPVTGENEPNPNLPNLVEDNWNENTISGGRVAAKWFVNEDWAITAAAIFQDSSADGENTYDPTVGDLQVIAFHPDTRDDKWSQFALTIEGDLGFADFVSATAYYTRDSKYVEDQVSYAAYFGQWCYYFTQNYNIYCHQPAGVAYVYNDPIGFLVNDQKNTSFSQEFRLSHQGEKLGWVAGVFWEERDEEWDFWSYTTGDGGYRNSQGFDNWVRAPSPPDSVYYGWGVPAPANPTDAWWFSADRTSWETKAVFGEVNFNFTDRWSGALGARWFDVTMDKVYQVQLPEGRLTPAGKYLENGPFEGIGADDHGCLVDQGPCNALDTDNPDDDGFSRPTQDDDDIAIKVSTQWNFTEDKMIYALYSEGFRPGGTNRNRGNPELPSGFQADFLNNYELGVKTQWFEGRWQANITVFMMDWEDYQLEVVEPSHTPCAANNPPPCGEPWQKVVTNVGDASSDGIEIQLTGLPVNGVEIGLNATFLDTQIDSINPSVAESLADSNVAVGDPLPFAPDFKGSIFAQYTWPMNWFGSNEAFVQLNWSYVDDSFNQVQRNPFPTAISGPNCITADAKTCSENDIDARGDPQMVQESYDRGDLKVGLVADSWEFNLFVMNVTDERGQIYHDITDFDTFWGHQRTSVIRPREFGARLFYRW
jgi:outer membrane receptor protein involved in Fe transport